MRSKHLRSVRKIGVPIKKKAFRKKKNELSLLIDI